MINFNSFISSFYPLNCKCCETPLVKGEKHFCIRCEINFGEILNVQKEEVNQLFWGKAKIKGTFTFFQFLKEENFQNLIHKLKYQGDRYLAFYIGNFIATKIKDPIYDAISFVPMHKKKQISRGFNQAQLIANGVGNGLNIPVVSLLERIEFTETQTEKGVFERFINMDKKFKFIKTKHQFKHILLIDDVITTGATLASCAKVLNAEDITVSIACLAYRSLN